MFFMCLCVDEFKNPTGIIFVSQIMLKARMFFLSFLFLAFFPGKQAAIAAEISDTLFVPGSAWLVGSASAITGRNMQGAGTIPCIMMNQYDNGFVFRVSGGGQHVLAMAIDFRQNAFQPGEAYRVKLAVEKTSYEQEFAGKAFDKTTLILNTQDRPELYYALSRGKTLRMTVGNSVMDFALFGMQEGLQRMEHCFSGKEEGGRTVWEEAALLDTSSSVHAQETEDDEAATLLTPMPAEQLLDEAAKKVQAIAPAAGPAARLFDVAVIRKDASSEKPVEQKVVEQETITGWQPPFGKQANRKIQDIIFTGTTPGEKKMEGRWRALSGANLREVLDKWAAYSDIRLLWMAGQDFPVRKSVVVQGTFETAVLMLLEQYGDEGIRPVGKMYNDSETDQKVLLIERYGTY